MKDSRPNEDYRDAIYATYLSFKTHPRSHRTPTEADYRAWAMSAQARLKGWLPSDRNTPILDLGCGTGNFLYLLEQLGYADVRGVDRGAEQVAIARQWCRRATVTEGDVRDVLSENAGCFGLITAFDLIEHFRKDEILPLLQLIVKALRPGGRLILQTPNAASPWMGSVAYLDFTHEWFFTPMSLRNMLELIGLVGFEARASGPFPHGIKSLIRVISWRLLTLLLSLYDLIETGSRGSGIYTRVFVATAVKK